MSHIGDIKYRKKWNRKVLNIYWVSVLIVAIFVLVQGFFTKMNFSDYIIKYFVRPVSMLLLILIITEMFYSLLPRLINPVLLVIISLFFVAVIIYEYPFVDVSIAAYYVPLLVAASFFDKKLLFFAGLTDIVVFISIYLTNEAYGERVNLHDFVLVFCTVVIGFNFCYVFINRGFDIVEKLSKYEQERTELLIENVIMDKRIKVDMLTGLYNQITFHKYLQELIEQNHKHNVNIQLAIIDIDNFKSINDTYGHLAGDEVLCKIATIISESVGPDDFVARYGGEEFAVIFVEKTLKQSYDIVENIRRRIQKLPLPELENSYVTISAGLQDYHEKWNKDEFFNKADDLLYYAKRSGKNQTKACC